MLLLPLAVWLLLRLLLLLSLAAWLLLPVPALVQQVSVLFVQGYGHVGAQDEQGGFEQQPTHQPHTAAEHGLRSCKQQREGQHAEQVITG
jgi:hypothetical protein